MAVLQISKIQVRRGQKAQAGIPALSAGEFAWAVDAQELYIGNGSVSEGAPFVGNTRLLTELDASNIFKLAGTYSYEGNTSATVITGADANSPVSRTLQDKLDDFVSLADFGAVGNGVANDTNALQRAIDQIYLNSDKAVPSARKKLRFPAGTYLITGTVYIPSYVTLEGDGIDRTIIKQATTGTAIFQTVDFTSTPTSKVVFPSIQSTTQPRNISVSGMTLQYDSYTKQTSGAMVYVDCAVDMSISNCKFLGLAAEPDNDTQEAIQIRGQGATTTNGLRIKDCQFKNISRGIVSDYDVTNIEVKDSEFDELEIGINFAENLLGVSPKIAGPTKVNIDNNSFDNIYKFAIWGGFNSPGVITNIVTQNNKFYNCGNAGSLDVEENQQFPVVVLQSAGAKSINNWFARTEANLSGVVSQIVPEIFAHVSYDPLAAQSVALPVQSFPTTIAVIPKTVEAEVRISLDYVARQPSLNVTRVGQVQVMTNFSTSTWSESFQYLGATTLVGDIQFSTSLNTATQTLSVAVTNPTGSVDTNLTYHYSVLY